MLSLIKPLVLTGLKSPKFKQFVVDLLEKLVEQTDNKLDDKALALSLIHISEPTRPY